MATAPLRPCLSHGCPALVPSGRCPRHQREYQQRIDEQRGTTSQRGYGWRYQQARERTIQAQPWCSICGRTEDLTADHLVPASRGGSGDETNLRTLCRRCNSRRGGRLAHAKKR